jgi:hypothetical protein
VERGDVCGEAFVAHAIHGEQHALIEFNHLGAALGLLFEGKNHADVYLTLTLTFGGTGQKSYQQQECSCT